MAGLLAQQLILLVIAVGSYRVYGTLTALENCSSVPEETFRLYNAYSDPATQGGMLQVCRSGIWTAVCNQGFGCLNAAPPACRTLGYGGENLRVATINTRDTGPWNDTYITSNYYQCIHASTLHNCTLTNSTENACRSVQTSGVGVWCLTIPLPVPQCTTGAVRLVGSNSSREGRVEYCYDGAWTQICSDFGMNEAIVACRQLGFSNPPEAIVYQDADQRFGITSNFSLIEMISCSSAASESSLNMCSISATCATQCNIFSKSFYGIRCLGGDACQEGSVKLVNASTALEGRVEVCYDGVWGPVCGGGLTEAYVICKILGYDAAPRHYAASSQYGSGDRPFAYQITRCFGWEMNLTDCDKTQQFNCSRSQAINVICRDGCTDGALRLVAGSSEKEGMVEVCADQTWRAVAHTAWWGLEEAEVVCRQLSLQTTGATNISFGSTNRSVLFTDVHCIGTENKLMDCTTNQLSYENGRESSVGEQVAGVSCNTQQSYVSLSTSTSQEQTAVTTRPSTTMTLITVPTPTASSNQQLIEYILAVLVAVAVAIIILLGVSLCVAIYKLTKSNKAQGSKDKQNLDDVKQQGIEIVYEELDAAHSSKHNSTVAENGKNEAKEQHRGVMEENMAYASVSINEAGKEDSEKDEDPTYT